MPVLLDSENRHSDISLTNGDLSAEIATGLKCPWFSFYKDGEITVNFGGSSFDYTLPSGFSAYGASTTLDSSNKHSDITLSNGDLTATGNSTTSWRQVAATDDLLTGKKYLEVTIDTCLLSNSQYLMIGIGLITVSLSIYIGKDTEGYGYVSNDGDKWHADSSASYGSSFETGDVVMMAIDYDASKIWWGKNGTWAASGDPAAGTNAAYTLLITDRWRQVAVTSGKSSGKWYWEVEIDNIGATRLMLGAGGMNLTLSTYVGKTSDGYGLYSYNGDKWNSDVGTAYGNSYTTNDIIMVALDMDNGKIWWGENGTWHNSGDPAAGTGFAFSGISGTIGCWVSFLSLAKITIVLKEPFTYTIPSGFDPYDIDTGSSMFLVFDNYPRP